MGNLQYETGWSFDNDNRTWRPPFNAGSPLHTHDIRELLQNPAGTWTFPGDLTINGIARLKGGTTRFWDGLELGHPASTPLIDFHRSANPEEATDYNVRLINEANGYLVMYGGVFKCPGGFDTNGTLINGTTGRNWFKDTEVSAGSGLRVGGAWGMYGIYAESGNVVIGGAGGVVYFQNGTNGYTDSNRIFHPTAVRANQAEMKSWPTDAAHAQFSHINRGGGEGYGFLQRWDGYVWISSTGTVNINCSNGVNAAEFNGTPGGIRLAIRGTDRFGSGDAHRFWEDGEAWHWSVGIAGDNGDNVGLKLNAGKGEFYRFDQIGNWDINPLWTSSSGGGSGARITFRAVGQNAAPQIKSWGQAFEFRSWDDGGFILIRASTFEVNSVASSKDNIQTATTRLAKAQRKQKIKQVRTVHYNRPSGKGCPSCVGTGKMSENRDLYPTNSNKRREVFEDDSHPHHSEPCPACNGLGMEWVSEDHKKNEESGWYGFVAEELAPHFPEVVCHRLGPDGTGTELSGIDPMGLIALLWEEVKDLEDRLVTLETKK